MGQSEVSFFKRILNYSVITSTKRVLRLNYIMITVPAAGEKIQVQRHLLGGFTLETYNFRRLRRAIFNVTPLSNAPKAFFSRLRRAKIQSFMLVQRRPVDKHKTKKHCDFCPPQARKFCILEAFTRGICIKKHQNFRRLRRANYYGNYHDYCDYNQIICQNSSSAFIKRAKTVHKPPLLRAKFRRRGGVYSHHKD